MTLNWPLAGRGPQMETVLGQRHLKVPLHALQYIVLVSVDDLCVPINSFFYIGRTNIKEASDELVSPIPSCVGTSICACGVSETGTKIY